LRGARREILSSLRARARDLPTRAALARELAARVAASLETADHPYSRLLESELRFVSNGHPSYIAHEFLAAHNHAYWRSDFLALARRHGLDHVADADFNYASGRVQGAPDRDVADARFPDRLPEDTLDLLAYRQLHSPILTRLPWTRRDPLSDDLCDLIVASCLEPTAPSAAGTAMFRHPTGVEVEAKEEGMRVAIDRLRSSWPRGLPVATLFPGGGAALADLRLLHAYGLIELRIAEADGQAPPGGPLNEREREWGGYATTRYHSHGIAI
jgi:hypothetical protein